MDSIRTPSVLVKPRILPPGGTIRVPVLHGIAVGHEADTLTIPLGVTATLDAGAGTLTIDEAGLQS